MENLTPLSPVDRTLRKRVSKRQIDANRKNGKLGGPKSNAGKLRVSRNAMKHALLAQEIVIDVGDGSENRRDFDKLFNELINHYDPQGPIEKILVEKIAVNHWRYRRFIRAENGEIRKHIDSLRFHSIDDQLREYEKSKITTLDKQGHLELSTNALELNAVLRFIQEVSKDLETLCYISDSKIDTMIQYFGSELCSVTTFCILHNKIHKEKAEIFVKNDKDPRTISDTTFTVELILKKLGQENERITVRLQEVEKREQMAFSAQTLSLSIPPKNIMDTFSRYEASILRQFYRAMNELERIQRQRKGDVIPPPINVEIGTDNN